MYTFLPEFVGTHDNLYRYNPRMKFVYLMRDPVERTASPLARRVVRGPVRLPPDAEVFRDPIYVNRSRYGVQLRPYLRLFGEQGVPLAVFEDCVASPAPVLERVQRFLRLSAEPLHERQPDVRNQSTGSDVVPNGAKRWLRTGQARGLPYRLRSALKNGLSRTFDEKPELSATARSVPAELLAEDVDIVRGLLAREVRAWRC